MKHARVLIVDSDSRVRSQLYPRLLEAEVFSDSVSNGTEALEHLGERGYGLILLDLDLPNDEAYSVIRSVGVLNDPPMILATAARDVKASADPELVQIVMRKPLRLGDVADMIHSCLGSALDAVSRRAQRSSGTIDIDAGDENAVRVVG